MKLQIAAMPENGGGTIVNMASVVEIEGASNLSAHVAGKAGKNGLSRAAVLNYAEIVSLGPLTGQALTYGLF